MHGMKATLTARLHAEMIDAYQPEGNRDGGTR